MRALLFGALFGLVISGCSNPKSEPASAPPAETAGPSIRFGSPTDGAEVSNPVRIEMIAEGIEVAPAGTFEPNTGHFHVLVDQPFVPAGSVVPADSVHIHFGTGATTTELTLTPGEHVLRLQMGDGAHIVLPGLQDEIRVVVQ